MPASERPPDLPGCEPIPLPASALDTFEARLEVWDGRTETAWVCEPVTGYHEQPTRRLAKIAGRIASVRGSPIESFGSMDLLLRDASGRKRWIMQADEVLYLHPERARMSKRAVEVERARPAGRGAGGGPHDGRTLGGSSGCTRSGGFPEIWVLVPWEESVRGPGLAIHVREDGGGYREAGQSMAFPGWTVEEIHGALTEEPLSLESYGALERVGRELGAREGRSPEDDPLTRSLSARARAEGRATGYTGIRTAVTRRRCSRCCALGGSTRRGLRRTPGSSPGFRSTRRWRRRWGAPERRTSGAGCARHRRPGAMRTRAVHDTGGS